MTDIDAMTDEELERALERHRALLNDLDWADDDARWRFKSYLVGKIRRLEGEIERRRAGGGGR